jgi:hypothetical protein
MKLVQIFYFWLILLVIFIIFISYSNFEIKIFNEIPKINRNEDLFKKANFKVNNTYALVFFGRRAQTQILMRFLVKNLKINGGVLDKIVFAVKTKNKEDLEYLDSIMRQNKTYFKRVLFPSTKHYREIYLSMEDNDLVFKIDDDIVFIHDGTFERMLEEYFNDNLLFLSANVVNHPLLSHVHARMMANMPFDQISEFQWTKSVNKSNLDSTECQNGEYNPFSKWWKNPKCTVLVHESFLYHALKNELDVYDFKKWDFHHMGYERWSINFVLMRGIYANKMKKMFPNMDNDEVAISRDMPKVFGKHCFSLGSAIVVHFSYYPQREFLQKTNLLQRYNNFSKIFLKTNF